MPIMKRKVYAYITHGSRLLVFRHVDFPEAGIQVPGGTVEPGEEWEAAALREAEETGLRDLRLVRQLGERTFDLAVYGRDEVNLRRFYHLVKSVLCRIKVYDAPVRVVGMLYRTAPWVYLYAAHGCHV